MIISQTIASLTTSSYSGAELVGAGDVYIVGDSVGEPDGGNSTVLM